MGDTPKLSDAPARCGQKCDHGSPCVSDAGHVPSDRHATAHGCVFYDAREVSKRLDEDKALVKACAAAAEFASRDPWGTPIAADVWPYVARAVLRIVENCVVAPLRARVAEVRATDKRLFDAAIDNASETTTDLLDTAGELDAAREALRVARELIHEIAASGGIEHDDARLAYVTIQVDRETLIAARAWLDEHEETT